MTANLSRRTVALSLALGGAAVAVASPSLRAIMVTARTDDPIYAAMKAHAEAEAAFQACFDIPEEAQDEAWQEVIDPICHASSAAAWAMLDVEIRSMRALKDFLDYASDNWERLEGTYEPMERLDPEIRRIVESCSFASREVWEQGAFAFIVATRGRLRQEAWA